MSAYDGLRPRLFGIAYRMTGSVADADDLCQEAWVRWSRNEGDHVDNPEAYLVSTITRLAIDLGRSAARRREYVGPYLPEPVLGRHDDDPEQSAELADSLTYAFLVLLDQLSPTERAVFLLHDVFAYPFDDIADAVGSSPAAVRQMASRSRRKVDAERVELRRATDEHEQTVIATLLMAMAAGDIDAVMAHLAPDVVQLDDGGPRQRAARRPIVGPDRVARMWVNLSKRIEPDWSMQMTRVNGAPGLLVRDGDEPFMTVSVAFGPDGLIRRIHCQLNPDKLTHLR